MQHVKRYSYILLGTICLVLAVLGAILPGLPTTVFVILAIWLFSRSSERMHRFLRSLPVLKQTLHHADHYIETRSIHLPVKLFAIGASSASVVLVYALSSWRPTWVVGIVLSCALVTAVFMWRTKTAD